jgi:diguanylate cyclase (GGDEF)-like protein
MQSALPLRLDPTTLLFSISTLGFVSAAFAFTSSRAIGARHDGLVEWAKSMACVGGAFLLYFFRGHGPAFLTYLLANAIVLAVPVYGLLAHTRFFAAVPPRRTMAALCALGYGGVVAVYGFGAQLGVAVFTMSVAVSVMFAMMGRFIVRSEGWTTVSSSRFTAAAMFLLSAICAVRAAFSAAGAGGSVSVATDSGQTAVVLVCGTLFVVGASTGFVMMVHDRQRRDELLSSRRDALTGLHTRGAFFEAVAELQARAHEPYALIVVDIDCFKSINDDHGHAGGDFVLMHAGRLILRSIRSVDLAGRYGGDEMCVVLRACGQAEARRFAEQLVLDAAQQSVRLPNGTSVSFTLSAGFATRQSPASAGAAAERPEQVFERADAALYRAKRGGKNRAVAATALLHDEVPAHVG